MHGNKEPIFFAWTRSFWATVIGLAVLVFGAPKEVLHSLGYILATFLPWSALEIGEFLVGAAPVLLWAFALQQRSHAARPYTLDLRKRQ